jgi:hypothetical protein
MELLPAAPQEMLPQRRIGTTMKEDTNEILARIREGLRPPAQAECDEAMARWLFGERAEKMMRHGPWSFVLVKLLWQEGEEPWRS